MAAAVEEKAQEVQAWLSSFEAALARRDVEAAVQHFHAEECFWRDLLTFTWNLYTAESQEEIREMLQATLKNEEEDDDEQQQQQNGHIQPKTRSAATWKLESEEGVEEVEEEGIGAIRQSFFTFETREARGRGYVKLVRGGKCWCLLTTMLELKGHEEPARERRELGVQYGAFRGGRRTWLDVRHEELAELGRAPGKQPFCLVVGGGQAGISLAARLRRLRVPTVVVDKNARPGDSWRNRYKSLCLHDAVWYDHLPYIPFPDHWPVFSPKDKIADWLEAYTLVMELVYWGSTECKSARFDAAAGEWEVVVDRAGEELVLHPVHLVLATGMSGVPNVPANIPGAADKFRGVQCHSSQHRGGDGWAGKHCVVVGSNNSAHDICADLWEHGAARVTMLQRSSTHVSRSETMRATEGLPYKEGSRLRTEDVDLLFAATPYKILHRPGIRRYRRIAELDADFYRALERVGFLHDFGDDESGLFMKYLRRGSGYYIDVGASDLVVKGEIALRSGVSVAEMRERSVVLSDGSELEADLVVYATGYGSMNGWAAKLISQDVADKVGKCWGLGSDTTKDPGPWERELRNMWKPTHQPHLWFHGGNLHQCRHYSLYLALQLKARLEGIPTPVYGMGKVHHTS